MIKRDDLVSENGQSLTGEEWVCVKILIQAGYDIFDPVLKDKLFDELLPIVEVRWIYYN